LVIYQESLRNVSLRIRALWDVRHCWPSGSWKFKELYCLHSQGSSGPTRTWNLWNHSI